jgi:hypothetical protein
MAGEWSWNRMRDPTPQEITAACDALQRAWTVEQRNHRLGKYGDEESSPPQFLVHHTESGRWTSGRGRRTSVWRCVDGR